jgi:hypothetical protein
MTTEAAKAVSLTFADNALAVLGCNGIFWEILRRRGVSRNDLVWFRAVNGGRG